MANKYNAKGQYCEGYWFPSTLELKLYHLLKKYDDKLILHPKLIIIRAKKPWKSVTWTPDFYSPVFNQYIEAKGMMTDTFKLKMQLINAISPGLIDHTWFVCRQGSYHWQGIGLMNIDKFQELLNEKTAL